MKLYRFMACCMLVSMLIVGLALPSYAELGVGARAIGMGGAFTAVADDDSAPYWNPAGLTHAKGFSFQPPNVQVRIDTDLSWRDVVDNPPTSDEDRLQLLKELGDGTTSIDVSSNTALVMPGFAISLIPVVTGNLSADIDIDPTTGDPRIDPITHTVASSGNIDGVAAYAVGLSFARPLRDGGSFGVTVKSMQSTSFHQLLTYGAVSDGMGGYDVVDTSPDEVTEDKNGLGIDCGYLREIRPGTTLGVMVRNLLEPNVDGEFANRKVNVGIAHQLAGKNVLLAADISSVFDHPNLNLGAEFQAAKMLSLWAGIYERKPTLGVGLNLLGAKLQFAYSPKNTSIMCGSLFF